MVYKRKRNAIMAFNSEGRVMGWKIRMGGDVWTWREFDALNARLERMRRSASATRIQANDRIADLEDDLARTTLLVHALAEVCVRKGLLTREEIAEIAEQIDLLDGQVDGKLDPATQRPPEDPDAAPRQIGPHEYLGKLERNDSGAVSPREFLEDLETAPEPKPE
jgi:hypothetical protein